MKNNNKFIALILYTFLVSFQGCANNSTQPVEKKVANQTIAADTIVLDSSNTILKMGLQACKIGDSIQTFISNFPNLVILHDEDYGYIAKQGDSVIVIIETKNGTTVSSVSIFSNNYETVEGIKVGLSISELKKIYPQMVLQVDAIETGEEYYKPVNYQTAHIVFKVYCKSFSNRLLGNYKKGELDEQTSDFSIKGYISKIEIYKTN